MAAVVATTLTTAPSHAGSKRVAHTKRQAEVNVLQAVARHWRTWSRTGLVNGRTHLLADNTEAVCRGRGKRHTGGRYARFVCVVRPHVHAEREGLWLKYQALSKGRFRVRVLAYRPR